MDKKKSFTENYYYYKQFFLHQFQRKQFKVEV